MTQDITVQEDSVLISRITNLIEHNISAISTMAEQLEIEEEKVRNLILKAIDAGQLKGHLTTDETRFYRSDVKMNKTTEDPQVEFEMPPPPSLLIPKVLIGSGIGLFIAGQVLIRMAEAETQMYNISTMLVFGGLVTIIAGMCSLTQIGSKKV